MRFFIQIMAAVALLLSTWVPASAETLDAKANVVNPVGFFYFHTSLEYGCGGGGKPVVRINRKPQNGTLKTEWRMSKMNSKGGCKGRPTSGLAVWYTPNKGYHGPDKFGFTMSVPGIVPGVTYGAAKNWNYKVNVK